MSPLSPAQPRPATVDHAASSLLLVSAGREGWQRSNLPFHRLGSR